MNREYRIVYHPETAETQIKKSRFICEIMNVRSETEALSFVDGIKQKNKGARHNCFAFRTGTPEKCVERFSDDGEPQGTAGRPMLAVLEGSGLYDVCAVVTRYFGGILLGTGGLVRAYSESVKKALSVSQTAQLLRGFTYSIGTDYSGGMKLKNEAIRLGCFCLDEEFTQGYQTQYLVPAELDGCFVSTIGEKTGNRAVMKEKAEVMYYMAGESPGIYR